jgi:hypothetical protein
MPDRAHRDGGPAGAVLLTLGLLLVLVAVVLLLAQQAPGRIAGIEGAARGALRGLIRPPFPNPERRVQPAPSSSRPEQAR